MKRAPIVLGIHALLGAAQMEALVAFLKGLPALVWRQKAPFTQATVSARMKDLQNESIQVVCELQRETDGGTYGTRMITSFSVHPNALSDPEQLEALARAAKVTRGRYKI